MQEAHNPNELIGTGQSSYRINPEADDQPAWVEIENGRFQPQRIKGSCLGRELG